MLERPWDQQYVASRSQDRPRRHQKSRHHQHPPAPAPAPAPPKKRPRANLKSLPGEILSQIFREVNKDDVFLDRKGRRCPISGRNSLLSTALVCQRFRWIVTPLLYAQLEICSRNEALIHQTLSEDPTLTKHVHHLRVSMPRRFKTWSMKYHFAPQSFALCSKYGTDMEMLDRFNIDRYCLKKLYLGDAMSVDLNLYIYISRTFPMLEDLTVESSLSFHSQWTGGNLEDIVSCLLTLRRLTHLRLNHNFNPSRTSNRVPNRTWSDLEDFLTDLPDRIQVLSFGSLGRSEEYSSIRRSLVVCSASFKLVSSSSSTSKHRHRSKEQGKYSSLSSTRKMKRRWKIEMPDYMKERIQMLSKWGAPVGLNEIYLYR